MAWEGTVPEVYGVVTGVFQLGVLALVLAAGKRDATRAAIALVLAFSAIETWHPVLRNIGLWPSSAEWIPGFVLDPLIVTSVAFLMSRIPAPLGGRRGERVARAAWVGVLVAFPLVAFAIGPSDPKSLDWAKLLPQFGGFAVAAFLFQAHVVPRFLALDPGPLRGQTLLLAAGLAVGVFRNGVNGIASFLEVPTEPGLPTLATVILAMSALMILAGIVRLAFGALSRRSRDAAVLAGIVATGLPLVALDHLFDRALGEFATQAIRPFLLASAMLRFDFVRLPLRARQGLFLGTGVAFALATFFALDAAIAGKAAQRTLSPVPAALALATLTVGVLVARRPLAAALRSVSAAAGDAGRLDRYRLALERDLASGGAPATRAAAEGLRRELRVTDDEHDTLAAILQSHLIVPTAAIRGAEPGARVLNRYEVLRELGRGGYGRALLARDEAAAGKLVVLKDVLRPWDDGADARRASLDQEARVGAKVDSPRLARVHALASDGYNSYLVRDYVAGETLAEAVRARGALSPERTEEVLADVLEGLQALHDARLLHLDLKPENVVLDERGRAVIIDFGAARARRDGAASATATAPTASEGQSAATTVGTLAWMAPEQVLGLAVDARTDVFAAGALGYYVVTGRTHVPLDGVTRYEVEDAIVRGGAPALPATTPAILRDMIVRALERDARARPATAREMATDLRTRRAV